MTLNPIHSFKDVTENYVIDNQKSKSFSEKEKTILTLCQKKTEELLSDLGSNKKIESFSIQYLLNQYAHLGLPLKITDLFLRLKEFEIVPNIKNNISLIQAYLRSKNFSKAKENLEHVLEMLADTDAVLGSIIWYTILIKACCVCEKFKVAEELVSKMQNEGLEPDDMMRTIVTEILLRNGEIHKAKLWFQKINSIWLPEVVDNGRELLVDGHGTTSACVFLTFEPLLEKILNGEIEVIHVITGKGLHSNINQPFAMRNAIIEFMSRVEGFQVTVDPENEGVVIIRKKSLDSECVEETISTDIEKISDTVSKIELKNQSTDTPIQKILSAEKRIENDIKKLKGKDLAQAIYALRMLLAETTNTDISPALLLKKYRKLLQEAVLLEPDSPKVNFFLGESYDCLNQGGKALNPVLAEKYYTRSIELQPDDYYCWIQLGLLFSEDSYSYPVRAKQALIRAHELDKSKKDPLVGLVKLVINSAHTWSETKERDILLYAEALEKLDKNNTYALFYLGHYYEGRVSESKKDLKLALKYYTKIYDRDRDEISKLGLGEHRLVINTLQRAAILTEKNGEIDLALKLNEKIELFDPNGRHKNLFTYALSRRAAIYFKKYINSSNQLEELYAKKCIQLDEKILDLDEKNVQSLIRFATFYMNGKVVKKNLIKGVEYYKKASAIEPENIAVVTFSKVFSSDIKNVVSNKKNISKIN